MTIYKCDDVMEMNRRERRRNNLAAGVTNYFGTGLDFCLTQPHNTFPDLHSYWLRGKVDQKSGKLIPKTFPATDVKRSWLPATAKRHGGFVSVWIHTHASISCCSDAYSHKNKHQTPHLIKLARHLDLI